MTSSPGCTQARMAVMMACVAPAVMVISVSASYWRPWSAWILAATAARNGRMPGIGGYWLWPARMASVTVSSKAGSQAKSGKPWPRLTASCSAAKADMTVKMVVPTCGSLFGKAGGRAGWLGWLKSWGVAAWKSEFVVIGLPAHRLGDEFAAHALTDQFGEFIDEIAQISPALEGHGRDVLAEQVPHGPHRQIPHRVFAHGHFGHDADAQAQAHIGLDHVGVYGFEHDARLQFAGAEAVVDL